MNRCRAELRARQWPPWALSDDEECRTIWSKIRIYPCRKWRLGQTRLVNAKPHLSRRRIPEADRALIHSSRGMDIYLRAKDIRYYSLHHLSRARVTHSKGVHPALEDRKIARVGISWARSRGRLRGDPTALAARAGHPPRPRHAPQIVSMIVSQSPRPMYTSRNRPQRTWSRIPDFANQGRRISPQRVACRAPRKL